MGPLKSEFDKLVGASLSESTWKSYNRAIQNFEQFRMAFHINSSWPVAITTILAYVAFMSKEGWAHSSICLHLSAIAFFHKMNNWVDPTDSFVVRKIKEGSRRLNSTSDHRRPITFTLLTRIVQLLPSVCKSAYEATLFKSVFLLAYFGFLRVGEYACTSSTGDTTRILGINDISFKTQENYMVVVIRFSKTDQVGNSTTIHIGDISDKTMCPLQAMRQFLQIRPVHDGALFIHFDKKPVTNYQVSKVLKLCLDSIGLNSQEFSPHSFRIGAATSAAMQGVPEETIKCFGRWSSNAVQTYIRPNRIISFI